MVIYCQDSHREKQVSMPLGEARQSPDKGQQTLGS